MPILQKMMNAPAFSDFIRNYNFILSAFLGIVTLSVLTLLFVNIAKLSAASDNDYKRRQAISGIMVCLVCLAIAGGLDVVYGILLSFIFGFAG